ncbi:MAG: hypothetical protein ACFFBD_17120 [Candidatus Hodarchaeota archaeon]
MNLLLESEVDKYEYIIEKMVCDDFALLLKEVFIRASYDDQIEFPYALGIIWGYKIGDPTITHAMNIAVQDTKEILCIEPQEDISIPWNIVGYEGWVFLQF